MRVAAAKLSKDSLFSRGAAREKNLAYFALLDRKLARKDVPHTRFVSLYQGTVTALDDVNWRTAGMCIVKKPVLKVIAVGAGGQVFAYVGGNAMAESIAPTPTDLRGCTVVGGYAYACGANREVFRRYGEGKWLAMHAPSGGSFEAMAGYHDREIYAVGADGEIWQLENTDWLQRASPVKVALTGVCCADDDRVYAVGQRGTLVVGRDDAWKKLPQPKLTDDLWDVCWFGGKLYAASTSTLYVLKGSVLAPVDFGSAAPKSCYRLTHADGVLWSIGQDSVAFYDGVKWTRWD